MDRELFDLLLKAAYAGHRYHLSAQATIDSIETGEPDTPGNDALRLRYWDEWRRLTEEAIKLYEQTEERA